MFVRFRKWWFDNSKAEARVTGLYNPRNVTVKVTPDIHVQAVVTIVLASGEELPDMYECTFSYEPNKIDRVGRELIERYNRMMDLSEVIR